MQDLPVQAEHSRSRTSNSKRRRCNEFCPLREGLRLSVFSGSRWTRNLPAQIGPLGAAIGDAVRRARDRDRFPIPQWLKRLRVLCKLARLESRFVLDCNTLREEGQVFNLLFARSASGARESCDKIVTDVASFLIQIALQSMRRQSGGEAWVLVISVALGRRRSSRGSSDPWSA